MKMKREWLIKIYKAEGYKDETEASDVVGITQQYFNLIVNKKRNPSVPTAKKMAKLLNFNKYGIDLMKFYEEEEKEKVAR